MRYNNAVVDWYDLVNSDLFLINEYDSLLEDLGFKDVRILFSQFMVPGKSLNEGLAPLMSDEDVLISLAKGKGVLIEEIVEDDDVENENEASTSKVAPLGEGCGISIYGFSDFNSSDHPSWSFECKNEKRQPRWSDEFQFRNLLCLTTTTPEQLAFGLQWFMKPLKYIGVPVDEVILTLLLSLRFINLVFDEVRIVALGIVSRRINWQQLATMETVEGK
ncbi:protein ABCI12, chloroplastic [Tanacetum coccineum]